VEQAKTAAASAATAAMEEMRRLEAEKAASEAAADSDGKWQSEIMQRIENSHVELLRQTHSLSMKLDSVEKARQKDAEQMRAEIARLREECARLRSLY